MIEEWRQIPGYEGIYEVSSYGRVRSLDRYVKSSYGVYRLHKGKVLSSGIRPDGYLVVCLQERMFRVHRLVAQVFIPNPDGLPQVNHKDENKSNNRVDNLEWCDAKYNNNYGTARIRARDTMLEMGHWSGLSKEEYRKKYYQDNKDKSRSYYQKYYQENKDKIKDRVKSYYQDHKKEYNEWKKEYRRKRKLL